MPDHPKPEKKKSVPSSEDIRVPPIPKQTAGAVTGAAIGSIAGPTGAVIGGVIGAVMGKAAADRRPVRKAVRRGTAVSKRALKGHPVKESPTKSREVGGRRLRQGCEKDELSEIVRSKVACANVTRVAQIEKVSAKIDIVACKAETPWQSHEKALDRLSRLLARNIAFHAGTLVKLTRVFCLLQFRWV
jgi:Glycine zipper